MSNMYDETVLPSGPPTALNVNLTPAANSSFVLTHAADCGFVLTPVTDGGFVITLLLTMALS